MPPEEHSGGYPAKAIRGFSGGQGLRNVGRLTVLGMIREIDIWRVALALQNESPFSMERCLNW
jgi:hypothetical protein